MDQAERGARRWSEKLAKLTSTTVATMQGSLSERHVGEELIDADGHLGR